MVPMDLGLQHRSQPACVALSVAAKKKVEVTSACPPLFFSRQRVFTGEGSARLFFTEPAARSGL